MAFRRRRKPRVLWLPITGRDDSDVPETPYYVNGPSGQLGVPADGSVAWDQVPITFDYSDSASNEQGLFQRSLQDLAQGNAYRLRRIVGKFHASVIGTGSPTQLPVVEVWAGFIINRTDDSGNSVVTIGTGIDMHPGAQDASEDPWIWRRKWLLSPTPRTYSSDSLSGVMNVEPYGSFPQTTADYGSVQDGPHIDQKTARVISNQERLFFWVAVHQATQVATAVNLNWWLDVRLLASLRQNQGNRRNATR